MISLEQLLRQRQDELRGRPHHWTDDINAWWGRLDWRLALLYAFTALWVSFVGGVLLALRW
jgi:hypothetical protein